MIPIRVLILLLIVVITNYCQRFDLRPSPSQSPGLRVDAAGKVYTSAGNQLYRFNRNLMLKETRVFQ